MLRIWTKDKSIRLKFSLQLPEVFVTWKNLLSGSILKCLQLLCRHSPIIKDNSFVIEALIKKSIRLFDKY